VSRLISKNPEWNERFKGRLPTVFIGIVAFQDIPHEIYLSHMIWALRMAARLDGKFRISMGMATRKEQYRARNHLVQQAEIEGADFLLMLDDDQTLHTCPEMIELFYELGQPIAGGLYWQRGGCHHPVIMKGYKGPGGKQKYRFYWQHEIPTEPAPVDVLGGGCHWLDMTALGQMKQPQWWPIPGDPENVICLPNPDYGLDVDFCQKARAIGYECWLHPGIRLGHLVHDRTILTEDSRPSQEEIERTEEWTNYMASVAAATNNHQ